MTQATNDRTARLQTAINLVDYQTDHGADAVDEVLSGLIVSGSSAEQPGPARPKPPGRVSGRPGRQKPNIGSDVAGNHRQHPNRWPPRHC